VIDYIKDKGTISPMVEGRLQFLTSTPDLSTSTKDVVDASGDGVAESGEILTYTITITNSGTYGAGFILTDTLPTGMTYVADSLDYTFPGTGFTATVTSNVLTAHTEGYLNPPTGASLYMPGVATLTFAAEVGDVEGTEIVNTAELVGDYQYWSLSATIPVEAGYNIYLPVIMKN